jgi:hypothetical protein
VELRTGWLRYQLPPSTLSLGILTLSRAQLLWGGRGGAMPSRMSKLLQPQSGLGAPMPQTTHQILIHPQVLCNSFRPRGLPETFVLYQDIWVARGSSIMNKDKSAPRHFWISRVVCAHSILKIPGGYIPVGPHAGYFFALWTHSLQPVMAICYFHWADTPPGMSPHAHYIGFQSRSRIMVHGCISFSRCCPCAL